jgi:hypothetical protein
VPDLALVALFIGAAALVAVVFAAAFVGIGRGRYAEQLVRRAARIAPLRRFFIRAYIRDLAKTDPLAARAFEKIERLTGDATGSHPSGFLRILTPAERRAYLALFNEPAAPLNRRARRQDARTARIRTGR